MSGKALCLEEVMYGGGFVHLCFVGEVFVQGDLVQRGFCQRTICTCQSYNTTTAAIYNCNEPPLPLPFTTLQHVK